MELVKWACSVCPEFRARYLRILGIAAIFGNQYFICKGWVIAGTGNYYFSWSCISCCKEDMNTIFGRKASHQPVLFFSSFFMRLRRFSIPRKSVIPYWKAIFSYSVGGAFLRISQTSTSDCDSDFPSPLQKWITVSECCY